MTPPYPTMTYLTLREIAKQLERIADAQENIAQDTEIQTELMRSWDFTPLRALTPDRKD